MSAPAALSSSSTSIPGAAAAGSSNSGAAEFCDSTVAKIPYHDFIRELKKNLLVIVKLWGGYSKSMTRMLFLVEFNTVGSLTEVWEEAMQTFNCRITPYPIAGHVEVESAGYAAAWD